MPSVASVGIAGGPRTTRQAEAHPRRRARPRPTPPSPRPSARPSPTARGQAKGASGDDEPLPAASFTPAVAAPVVAFTAVTRVIPPVARARSWLFALGTSASPAIGKSLAVESAHTKAPWVLALACRPAARLYAPP